MFYKTDPAAGSVFFSQMLNKKAMQNDSAWLMQVRSTGLEPVPVAGHAPQTCAYADSATTADEQGNYTAQIHLCQAGNSRSVPILSR